MSIRSRMTLVVVVLAALAVGTVDVTTFLLLQRDVHASADANVREVAHTAVVALRSGQTLSLATFAGADRPVLVETRNAHGTVTQRVGTSEAGRVRLPADLLSHLGRSQEIRLSDGGRPAFRVIAVPAPGGTVIAAISLKSEVNTLAQLVRLNLIVGAVVLSILAIVAAIVLTRSLRPLRRIALTADAIAAGDRTARVPKGSRRTEIGRVATALNRMLDENEAAFAQRDATEDKLRRFLADASHELRTPLTSIRGYAELFRRGASQRPEDLTKAMRAIEDEAARMGILVEDLLLFARLDDGRPLERAPVALDDLAEAAVDAARVIEPDRTFSFEVSERPLLVAGDRDRLRQALDNLLTNIREHTPPGSPAYLSLTAIDDELVLTVEDAGPGVPDSERERIFDRFFRPDTHRSRTSGGAGLGLAIVRSIISAHSGEISVRPAQPHGSIFEIHLPRLDTAAGTAPRT
jgi:two-component system, OmpR family, sensor kinase